MNRPGRKRLSLEIPLWLYQEIKRLSGERNITLTRWSIRALTKEMSHQNRAHHMYSDADDSTR